MMLQQDFRGGNEYMINDDRNRRNAHRTGDQAVNARKRNIKRADLALNPFGMKRRSLARGR